MLRHNCVVEAFRLLGCPYIWSGNSPEEDGGVDCSGLVVHIFRKFGVIDEKCDMSSQTFAELSKPVRKPKLAALAFYGKDWKRVTHMAVHIGMGRCISARGGNHTCDSVLIAESRGACVKLHDAEYRKDFLGYRDFIDAEET